MANEYLVGPCQPLECAACCWVEVYDRDPLCDENAVRLKAGYISEAKDTLEQLCALLPLEECEEVFCTKPGRVCGGRTIIVNDCSKRVDVEKRLRNEEIHNYIYHNNKMPIGKLQLVLVRVA
jgi:hypothetical protein